MSGAQWLDTREPREDELRGGRRGIVANNDCIGRLSSRCPSSIESPRRRLRGNGLARDSTKVCTQLILDLDSVSIVLALCCNLALRPSLVYSDTQRPVTSAGAAL